MASPESNQPTINQNPQYPQGQNPQNKQAESNINTNVCFFNRSQKLPPATRLDLPNCVLVIKKNGTTLTGRT